jgi:cytochrome c
VNDKEDGTIGRGIDAGSVFVSFDYLKEGRDLALLQSNAAMTGRLEFVKGQSLIANSDCKTCHALTDKSIGPDYMSIAKRYKSDAVNQLADKIILGGNGNWGKNMMAAHPQHTKEEAVEMVKYILSVDSDNQSLPVNGVLNFNKHKNSDAGNYIVRAIYTDKGGASIGQLTGSKMLVLRSPRIEAEELVLGKNMSARHIDGTTITFVTNIENGAYLILADSDLTGVGSIDFSAQAKADGVKIELRLDSPGGRLIGQVALKKNGSEKPDMKPVSADIEATTGKHDIYFVFKSDTGAKDAIADIDNLRLQSGK